MITVIGFSIGALLFFLDAKISGELERASQDLGVEAHSLPLSGESKR